MRKFRILFLLVLNSYAVPSFGEIFSYFFISLLITRLLAIT